MCIEYDYKSHEVEVALIYVFKHKILQIQLNSEVLPSKHDKKIVDLNQIFVLDNSFTLTLLKLKNYQPIGE